MSTDSERVAETIEYVALRRLQNRYADIVTRRAWAELAEIMRPTCTLSLDLGDTARTLDGPEVIGEFICGQLEQFTFFEFVILNTVIEINHAGATAGARLYMQELRQNVNDGRRTNAFGVYHDHLERDPDGRWWFARRRYGSFSRTQALGPEHEQVVFDLPVLTLDEL